jgi:thioredoxin-related protein
MIRPILLVAFCAVITLSASAEPLQWLSDYNQALQAASTSGKSLLIYCVQESCEWCTKMENRVLTDLSFVRLAQNFIRLRMRMDDQSEGSRVRERFGVVTVPTLLVIDPTGRLLNRISGYMEPSALIADIHMIQEFIRLEKKNPDDVYTIQKLAEEYLARDMNAEAEYRFRFLLQKPIAETSKESAHFSLAIAQYYQKKNNEAIQTLLDYQKIYPGGRSIEDAMLLLAQIFLETDNGDAAKQVLGEFLQRFPASKNASRAREVLKKL